MVYAALGQASRAEATFESALRANPDNLESLAGLAGLYLSSKQPEKALQRVNRQMATMPPSARLCELQGQIYLNQKNYVKAEEAYRKAISIDKNSINAYALLGQLFMIQKSPDKAIPELQKILGVNPKSGQTHVLLGQIYETVGNNNKARFHYSEALKIDPGLAVAANNLAWRLCESGGSLDEALRLARSAKDKMPDSTNVSDTLAWIYYRRAAYSTAVGLLEECVKKEPQNATYQYHLGMSYYRSGDAGRAKERLLQALKLDPNLQAKAEIQTILAKLN
jgi:tetratricopeptide (TPR) repeat protein